MCFLLILDFFARFSEHFPENTDKRENRQLTLKGCA